MKTCIFDLETFTLHANTGILLCCSYKEYDHGRVKTIRADSMPNWKTERRNVKPMCEAVVKALRPFDIFVAHNGQRFDKNMITSWAIRYNLDTFLRFSKFCDPVIVARKHLRLTRNDLGTVAAWLRVPHRKTPIDWDEWTAAAYDGDTAAMDRICHHCEQDIKVLEGVHSRMCKLVKDVNERGSAF